MGYNHDYLSSCWDLRTTGFEPEAAPFLPDLNTQHGDHLGSRNQQHLVIIPERNPHRVQGSPSDHFSPTIALEPDDEPSQSALANTIAPLRVALGRLRQTFRSASFPTLGRRYESPSCVH